MRVYTGHWWKTDGRRVTIECDLQPIDTVGRLRASLSSLFHQKSSGLCLVAPLLAPPVKRNAPVFFFLFFSFKLNDNNNKKKKKSLKSHY